MNGIPFYDLAAEMAGTRGEFDAAYRRVMDRGWFILGQELEAFEKEFAQACGVTEAVGVGNGLDALTLTLRALDIGPGDEVIVAAHTFVATWLAIAAVGATPVPCEPGGGRFAISAQDVKPLITARTRAVMPVHLYGIPAPAAALAELCRAHDLYLVEDAAQAHGARHAGLKCGSFGIAGCFSFYPSKNLGAFGDGGAVVTSDGDLAQRLRRLRNYGSTGKYQHEEVGWNSRLDEMQAAFLRVRLAHLEVDNARRRALAARYLTNLGDIAELTLPTAESGDVPVWHLFVIRTPARDRLKAHLAAAGIQTAIHYPNPVYRMPPFAAYGPDASGISDELAAQVLSLPLWPAMPVPYIDRISDEIRMFFTA